MAIVFTKLFVLLGLYWMSKVGVTLGQSRECTDICKVWYDRSNVGVTLGQSRECARINDSGDSGWLCDSGDCIRGTYVCDGGRSHCSDGSDESPSGCCPSTCPSDPDICIPTGQEVLPGQDCRSCIGKLTGKKIEYFPGWRCNSGQCVGKSEVCDGISQCPDGSDESPATCCASTCPSDPDICIPAGQKIKPGQDCRNCTHSWGGPGWRCNSGQCLAKKMVCNGGKPQCPDGSDESLATCCTSTCPSDPDICIPAGQEILPGQDCRNCTHRNGKPGWRCNSGQCLAKKMVCNGGKPQCSDGSDESPTTCCTSTCPSDPDICIQAEQEILPGQDCRNCSQFYRVPVWRCNSGQCLGKSQVCDGSPDCSDGSDESTATCCASTCPSDPDICIPPGEDIQPGQHCRDCTAIWYGMETPGWRCNSGQCLEKYRLFFTNFGSSRKSMVCDGSPQCFDGSDESAANCG